MGKRRACLEKAREEIEGIGLSLWKRLKGFLGKSYPLVDKAVKYPVTGKLSPVLTGSIHIRKKAASPLPVLTAKEMRSFLWCECLEEVF